MADLPDDLLTREHDTMNTDEYLRFWRGIEIEANDLLLPIKIGQIVSIESFDPSIFAALCSPNLKIALKRISRYKRQIMSMTLHIKEIGSSISLALEWLDTTIEPPVTLVTAGLVFFVQLDRPNP